MHGAKITFYVLEKKLQHQNSRIGQIPPVDSFGSGFVSFQGLSRFSAIAIPSLHTTNYVYSDT